MTWTYSAAALATTPLYQVRLLIGDLDPNDAQVQDEEITAYLPGGPLAAGSIYLAAAQCCEAIASAYARQVNVKISNTSANLEPRMQHYRDLAKSLRAQNIRYGGVVPYSGGISIGDIAARNSDPDRRAPDFSTTTGDDQGGLSGTQPNGWPN